MRRAMIGCKFTACVLMLVLGVTTGCTIYGGKKHRGWSGATGGEDLERQFWADLKSKNFTELEKHMAVSWVYLSPSGPLDRAATIERFRQTPIADYSLGDFKVTPNGHDIVVTYTATISAPKGKQARPDNASTEKALATANASTTNGSTTTNAIATPLKMMTVWQRVEKGWIAIAHAEVHSDSP